jgi:uncharacterized protein YggT (Ycf19 family)
MNFTFLLSEVLTSKMLLVNVLNTSIAASIIAVRLFHLMISIRYTLNWFPTINPFIQPFFVLQVITDPYLELFDKFFPAVLGIDLSVIVAFTFLEWIIFTLKSIQISA